MKKSYFFLAIVLVLFLGAWKIQTPVHNQEVVLQYSDEQISSIKVQDVVDAIKEELFIYGIEDVQVYEDENGILKISYYSEEDVQTIKSTLESLALTNFPIDDNSHNGENDLNLQLKKEQGTYKLEVFEIHNSENGSSGLGGKTAIVASEEFSKPITPNSFTALNKKTALKHLGETNRSSKINGSQTTYFSSTSNLVPDVRAGPYFI